MTKIIRKISPFLLVLVISTSLFSADSDIRVNSIGFIPSGVKGASVVGGCTSFDVRRVSNGTSAYSGTCGGSSYQNDVGQTVSKLDFTSLTEEGDFYLDVAGVGQSVNFTIARDVYNMPYYHVMRAMYLWRCGMAVDGWYGSDHYQTGACHLNDGYQDYIGGGHVIKDGTQGWHDAGDYGKYTVNAGITVGMMFKAWELYRPVLENISLDIPDTAPGYPDYLKEMKWEMDWVLKMQYYSSSAGGYVVSHKLTRTDFSAFIMPQDDTADRYFVDWGSAATADFVAMCAMGSRIFRPYDSAYADTLLAAAWDSYNFLLAHTANKAPDQSAFSTGGYGTTDTDDRLWAAAEMWETTGDSTAHNDFINRANNYSDKTATDWDWGEQRNLGMYTYLLSARSGKNTTIENDIRNDLINDANTLVGYRNSDVYARTLGGDYYWGCNGALARTTMNLLIANEVSPDQDYVDAALDAIGHIFGRNYYNRSYVTGLGINPPMNPHDRRSGSDGITNPWPGYLVGGGHDAQGWVDVEASYETNEIAINWQGALIFALAAFTDIAETPTPTLTITGTPPTPTITPTATQTPVFNTIRVNCGGPQYTDGSSNVWLADQAYVSGSWGYQGGGGVGDNTGSAIGGTTDDTLYQTERYGNPSYLFDNIPDGEYTVTLKFSENYWTSPGSRVFDVMIEGITVVNDLDIYQQVGDFYAYDAVVNVTVTDGQLTITSSATADGALFMAIQIARVVLTPTRTPNITDTYTHTRTVTPTRTPTRTSTPTRTATPSYTPTATGTGTGTSTPTFTLSVTRTNTPTPASTATETITLTVTNTVFYPTATATPTETQGPMADLVITSVEAGYEILPMCILGTEPLGTRISYRNQGTLDSGPFVVDLDGNTIEVSLGVVAGGGGSVWFAYYSAATITAMVDSTFMVTESSEMNNTYIGLPDPPAPVQTCTYTFSYTDTPTNTPTVTLTDTPSGTSTDTPLPTNTITPTVTPTITDTYSANTYTATRTFTETATITPTFTPTPADTGTMTATPSFSPTLSSTETPLPTLTETPTITDTFSANTFTATRTFTGTPTVTGSQTPTESSTAIVPLTFTVTQTTTDTWQPTMTMTATVPLLTPTVTGTPDSSCVCAGVMGKTSVGAQINTPAGAILANKYTLMQEVTAGSISVYINATTGGLVRMAIYSSINYPPDVPDSLVVESAAQAVTVGWNEIDIPDTLLAPGIYWIAIQSEAGTEILYDDTGDTEQEAWVNYAFGAFPAAFPVGNLWSWRYSMYVNYCPSECLSPTPTATVSPTNPPSPTITPTATISITPTYVVACSCEDKFGMQYIPAGSANPVGYVIANWYGIAEDGNALSMGLYVESGTGNAVVAIYTDNGGQPQNLIVQSEVTAVSPGWNTIPIPQVGLAGGTVYWLAYQVEAGVYVGGEIGASGDMAWSGQTFGAFPGTFSVGGLYNESYAINVNYCPVTCPDTPTPTATASPTTDISLSATITPTITESETQNPITQTSTATGTATPSFTTTATPGFTASPTATFTATVFQPSPTVTVTFTYTLTATATATPTVTGTFTLTMTPTFTFTPAATDTVTPTPEPTAVPTETELVIDEVITGPNPVNPGNNPDMLMKFRITQNCVNVEISIYTSAMRLVRRIQVPQYLYAGRKDVYISTEDIRSLANGIYFYTVTAESDTGDKARAKEIGKIIILR